MSDAPNSMIQPLTERAQFRDAVRLQKEIWQFADIELLPVRLFVVATKIGGQVLGAYDGPTLVGFALAIPGIKPGYGAYLHSHMVGVQAAYRNLGVGRMLKVAQREDALARGIELMEWTFDPLELKNAFFNIERLGAVVRRYVRNQYGITTSALQSGLPTDRCIAEWWMKRDRLPAAAPLEKICVPNSIAEIRHNDSARAKEIQAQVSDQFEAALERGLAVTGFERTPETGNYLLGRWE
jgi:predicted GNAT superfamily acetyltransferase